MKKKPPTRLSGGVVRTGELARFAGRDVHGNETAHFTTYKVLGPDRGGHSFVVQREGFPAGQGLTVFGGWEHFADHTNIVWIGDADLTPEEYSRISGAPGETDHPLSRIARTLYQLEMALESDDLADAERADCERSVADYRELLAKIDRGQKAATPRTEDPMPRAKKRGASTPAADTTPPDPEPDVTPGPERCQPLPEPRHCRVCHCTDEQACPEGCSWVAVEITETDGLCTACDAGLDREQLARFAEERARVLTIEPNTPERFRAERDLDLAIETAKEATHRAAAASPAPVDPPAEPEAAAAPVDEPGEAATPADAASSAPAPAEPARNPKRKRPSRAKAKPAAPTAADAPERAEPATGEASGAEPAPNVGPSVAYGMNDIGQSEPYLFDGCTKVLSIRILPATGDAPATVLITGRTHQDAAVPRSTTMAEVGEWPAPIAAVLDSLRDAMPANADAKLEEARAAEATRKAEEAKRRAQAEKTKAEAEKTRVEAARAREAAKVAKREKAERPVLNKELRDRIAKAKEAEKAAKAAKTEADKLARANAKEAARLERERAKLAATAPAPAPAPADAPAPKATPKPAPRPTTPPTEQFGLFGE